MLSGGCFMHKKPDYLQKKDRVVIIAPSGKVRQGTLDCAVKQLTSWGLEVTIGDHVHDDYYYFSASDQNRLHDLQHAINSPEYKAIFCARGGYGLTRIIDQVDFSPLQKSPKWVVGFSDITALHLALSAHGLQSIHSVMPTGFSLADQRPVDSLRKVLFGKNIIIKTLDDHPNNRKGEVVAPIIGGNLSLLSSSIGTKHELDTEEKILFIEEIDEYLYKIDRMFTQLRRSEKLSKLKGLVIGQMSQIKDTTIPFGIDVYSLILDRVSQHDYPVLFQMPIGHEPLNLPLIQEAIYQMKVNENGGSIELQGKNIKK